MINTKCEEYFRLGNDGVYTDVGCAFDRGLSTRILYGCG